ncbi:hypothetical protein C3L33_08357, partial [Rhododendron williamsianum]
MRERSPTAMADDPLTEELEPGSKVVGRAQGINRVLDPVRETRIVGGSGLFMFARGYALARTVRYSLKTGDAVVEYNVFVTTLCNAWVESF